MVYDIVYAAKLNSIRVCVEAPTPGVCNTYRTEILSFPCSQGFSGLGYYEKLDVIAHLLGEPLYDVRGPFNFFYFRIEMGDQWRFECEL